MLERNAEPDTMSESAREVLRAHDEGMRRLKIAHSDAIINFHNHPYDPDARKHFIVADNAVRSGMIQEMKRLGLLPTPHLEIDACELAARATERGEG